MASAMAARRSASDQSQFLRKWLAVWVALLAIVTLVVVVFLVTITNSLASINENLAVADEAVTGIGGDTTTLPDEVDEVNASLGGIDPNLKPIPGQADAIIASLTTINDRLTSVDSSLVDTSGILRTVLGEGADIRAILVDADNPPDGFGVQNIHQRIAFANGRGNASTGRFGANDRTLQGALTDLDAVVVNLDRGVNSLTKICRGGLVNLLGVLAGPPGC
jgi:hypothetical protein